MAFAFQQPDVGVVADDDVKVAVSADFLQKPDMAGVKPVVAAGDDHFLSGRATECAAAVRGNLSIRPALKTR